MNKNLYRLIAGNYRSAEIQLRGECIKIIKCLTICFILGLIDNCLLAWYYSTICIIFAGNILKKERTYYGKKERKYYKWIIKF